MIIIIIAVNACKVHIICPVLIYAVCSSSLNLVVSLIQSRENFYSVKCPFSSQSEELGINVLGGSMCFMFMSGHRKNKESFTPGLYP